MESDGGASTRTKSSNSFVVSSALRVDSVGDEGKANRSRADPRAGGYSSRSSVAAEDDDSELSSEASPSSGRGGRPSLSRKASYTMTCPLNTSDSGSNA